MADSNLTNDERVFYELKSQENTSNINTNDQDSTNNNSQHLTTSLNTQGNLNNLKNKDTTSNDESLLLHSLKQLMSNNQQQINLFHQGIQPPNLNNLKNNNNNNNNKLNVNNNNNNNDNNDDQKNKQYYTKQHLSTSALFEQSTLVEKYVPEFPDPESQTEYQPQTNNNNIVNENKNNTFGDKVKIITDDNIPVEFAVLGQPPKSNHINVSADHRYGIRNYLVRARRMLRLKEDCIICGIGSAVATACEVAEVLKREKIGQFKCIQTDIDANDQPYIKIVLKRGCYAHLVSDFRRRKIIEIFENNDINIEGFLNIKTIKKMELDKKFKPDDMRIKQATLYLENKINLNLPEFVYYCSILVHPLLLEYHFKTAIQQLGGVVDVHEGDLPVKQSPNMIKSIQALGIVPTPDELKILFPMYSNMHRDKDISIQQHKQLYHETHPKGKRNDEEYERINKKPSIIVYTNKEIDDDNEDNKEYETYDDINE